jgi:hypothetical protein
VIEQLIALVVVIMMVLLGTVMRVVVVLKVKVNFTLEQATKVQRGSRGIALLFL